jgi:TrmH family RNA methyltransferase
LSQETFHGASSVVFVLVEVRSPGNVGAVCRVANAFGMNEVRLVRPQADPRDPEAVRLAHGAEEVLSAARVFSDLDEALRDCGRAFATTARSRDWSRRILSCEDLVAELGSSQIAGPLAVVFGPEDRGLTNEDLARCDAIVSIRINERSSATLSLPASAAIIAYSLARGATPGVSRPPARGARSERGSRALPSSQIDVLLEEIRDALDEIGFRARPNEVRFRGSLRDFLARARPTEGDRLFLRHMLAQLGKWKRRMRGASAPDRAIRGGNSS